MERQGIFLPPRKTITGLCRSNKSQDPLTVGSQFRGLSKVLVEGESWESKGPGPPAGRRRLAHSLAAPGSSGLTWEIGQTSRTLSPLGLVHN